MEVWKTEGLTLCCMKISRSKNRKSTERFLFCANTFCHIHTLAALTLQRPHDKIRCSALLSTKVSSIQVVLPVQTSHSQDRQSESRYRARCHRFDQIGRLSGIPGSQKMSLRFPLDLSRNSCGPAILPDDSLHSGHVLAPSQYPGDVQGEQGCCRRSRHAAPLSMAGTQGSRGP
jgi:hypothetical protein